MLGVTDKKAGNLKRLVKVADNRNSVTPNSNSYLKKKMVSNPQAEYRISLSHGHVTPDCNRSWLWLEPRIQPRFAMLGGPET